MQRRSLLTALATAGGAAGSARAASDPIGVAWSNTVGLWQLPRVFGMTTLSDTRVLVYGSAGPYSEDADLSPMLTIVDGEGYSRVRPDVATSGRSNGGDDRAVAVSLVPDEEGWVRGVFGGGSPAAPTLPVLAHVDGTGDTEDTAVTGLEGLWPVDAAPTEAGYLLALVDDVDATDGSGAVVSPSGAVSSQFDLDPERRVRPSCAASLDDGGVVVGGSTRDGGWVGRFDGGDRTWTHVLDDVGPTAVRAARPVDDGVVVAAGGATRAGASDGALVAHLDDEGSRRWAVTTTDDQPYSVPESLVPLQSDGYLLGGTRGTGERAGLVARANGNGIDVLDLPEALPPVEAMAPREDGALLAGVGESRVVTVVRLKRGADEPIVPGGSVPEPLLAAGILGLGGISLALARWVRDHLS